MPHSYVTRDEIKTRLNITDNPANATLKLILEAVAQEIDDWVYRSFQPKTATRYYTATKGNFLVVKDLLTVTTLKTDDDGDRTYENTWATTDYDLLPFNASADLDPYTEIVLAPDGTLNFPTGAKGVEIAGSWGYFNDTSSVGTLGAAITTTTGTSVTMTAGHSVEVLHTLLIGTEQLYVTEVATDTLTVVRGVNGTDAATALDSAAVSAYVYRGSVREAAVIQAARTMRRADSPFGVVGSTDYGTVVLRATLDPDVKTMLAPLRRIAVA
jgi:hypothetical protein